MKFERKMTLDQACETARRVAVTALATQVAGLPQGGHPCGFLLCGSAADFGSFTVHSDLDLHVLAPNVAIGEELAAQLKQAWDRLPVPHPPLSISLQLLPGAIDDPYWRVALWLGSASNPLRLQIIQTCLESDCRRSHLLESFFEYLACRLTPTRHNLRTHPGALRALWLMKHITQTGLPSFSEEPIDWLGNLMNEGGFPGERITFILQFVQRLRFARCVPTSASHDGCFPVNEPWGKLCRDEACQWLMQLEQSVPPLSLALKDLYHVRFQELGIDSEDIVQFVGSTRAEKIRAIDAGDVTRMTALAWCESEEYLLSALTTFASEHPMIRMGLAFNRATPALMIRALLESAGGPHSRPLFRRRCLFHASWKRRPPKDRIAFWIQNLAEESSPLLRSDLQKVIQKCA